MIAQLFHLSVQSTPLLQGSNQLLFSPALSDLIPDDIGSTPTCSDFGSPYTTTVPLITPTTSNIYIYTSNCGLTDSFGMIM